MESGLLVLFQEFITRPAMSLRLMRQYLVNVYSLEEMLLFYKFLV